METQVGGRTPSHRHNIAHLSCYQHKELGHGMRHANVNDKTTQLYIICTQNNLSRGIGNFQACRQVTVADIYRDDVGL